MLPSQTTLSALFEVTRRFAVPLYQRTYVWSEDNHTRMWDMVIDRLEQRVRGKSPKPRFLGTVVFSPYSFGNSIRTDLVVDGQQRLTTLQLLFSALKHNAHARGFAHVEDRMKAMTVNSIGSKQPRIERFKVSPTTLDQPQFELCLDAKSADEVRAASQTVAGNHLRLVSAYQRFYSWINEFVDDTEYGGTPEDRMQHLLDTLMNDLLLVTIDLNNGEDPQEIFETLNFGGTPLAPSDLLRNWLLLRAGQREEDISRLYDAYWRPFDSKPWTDTTAVARRSRLNVDLFVHHYLTAVTGSTVNADKLYTEYKTWSEAKAFPKVEDELKQLSEFSRSWLSVMSMKGIGPIERLARVAITFEVGPLVPLLLALSHSPVPEEDRNAIAADVESFIVRREVCKLTAKNYNNTMLSFIKQLGSPHAARKAIRAELLSGTARTTKWPSDQEFKDALVAQPLYDRMAPARLQWILWELEEASRDKKVENLTKPSALQIEHIMPESWHTTWPLSTGEMAPADHDALENWFNDAAPYKETRERERLVHTLGNLTLITGALNQSYGNDPFKEKIAEMKRHSLLAMNQKIIGKSEWDVAQVTERSQELSTLAIARWPR